MMILYAGQVQGVGFRYTLYQIASRLALSGYIQNTDNGNVLAILQGENENIDSFLQESTHLEDELIRVDDYLAKELPPVNGESGIKVF